MSEYQYYEFLAIDRPLTEEEIAEVRRLSTRATITSTRFVNVYNWGSFKGDPVALVKRYYDAFLYVANWGSHKLMLRLPKSALDEATARRHTLQEEAFTLLSTAEHLVLSFDSETEEPEDWEEGEGWLARLVPLRADIAAGDLRALYLGWLMNVQGEIVDEDAVEPPVPPGLGELSASLGALADFLRIDEDLLQTAAEGSAANPFRTPSEGEARRWLDGLTGADKDDLLLRLARGDAHLLAEVRRRIRAADAVGGAEQAKTPGRMVRELLARADRLSEEREKGEAQEEAAARAAYLEGLAGREEGVWRQVEDLIEAKRAAEYAEAVRLLTDLRDLAARKQRAETFEARLKDLRARNARRVGLLGRLNEAGLRPAGTAR